MKSRVSLKYFVTDYIKKLLKERNWIFRLGPYFTRKLEFVSNILSVIAGFIPPNDVIRYFELLMDEIHNNFNDECDDLIDYFEGTYIYFIQFINDTQDQCTSGARKSCSPVTSSLPYFYTDQNYF